ncbi:MAG: hypothetical protein ACPG47_08435 [Leucothrix sp.]
MNGIKPSVLCLLASLGTSAQAARPAEIQLSMTQLTGQQCVGELKNSASIVPGDCITYRIEVKNIGEKTARYVEVTALIPEHTELHTTFRRTATQEMLGSVIEKQADGQRVIKTTLDTLHASDANSVVLEYSVKVM